MLSMFSTFYSSVFTITRVVECLIDCSGRFGLFVVYLFGICMIYTTPDVTAYPSLLAQSGYIEWRQLVDDYLL